MRRAKKAKATPAIVPASEHRRTIARRIEQLAYKHSTWHVFSDFVELSAISISNAIDLADREKREARYREIVKRYEPDEMAAFPVMLGELVLALEGEFDDVLGRLFHDLELHNHFQGQFFTPYALCQALATVTLGDRSDIDCAIAERGYMTALEPACGGGAMMIALAEALKNAGINYQQQLHVTAVDVDLRCVHMTFVQLALLGVPAVVVHGNSLSLVEYSHWRTPMHQIGGWEWRLRCTAVASVEAPETPAVEIEPVAASGEQLSLLENVA